MFKHDKQLLKNVRAIRQGLSISIKYKKTVGKNRQSFLSDGYKKDIFSRSAERFEINC